jgi:putative endonuclease
LLNHFLLRKWFFISLNFKLLKTHYFYIIYSKLLDKYYVGESEYPTRRVELHNGHYFKKAFTKSANDWALKLVFECENKGKAQKLERFVKRMKSRKFIEKIIANQSILETIYSSKI